MEGLIVKKEYTDETYIVAIKADVNDGDYITEIGEYNKEDFEATLWALMEISYFYGKEHQFDRIPSTLAEYVDIPHGDGDRDCHTLEEIKIYHIIDGKTEELELDTEYMRENISKILAKRILDDIKNRNGVTLESILYDDSDFILGFDPEITVDRIKDMESREIEEHLDDLCVRYPEERGKALYIVKEFLHAQDEK